MRFKQLSSQKKSGLAGCISSRITTVIQVGRTIKQTITDLMSHSQFHNGEHSYLDMHGLIFETSIIMTTGRINQETAFLLRPQVQARSSRTPRGTGYGTCLARPNRTALVTAWGLDFALLRTNHHTPVCNHFTQASSSAWSGSWSVSRRTHNLQLPRPAALWAV